MKEEQIYDGITNIREDLIEWAGSYEFRKTGEKQTGNRKLLWITLASAAACLMLIFATPLLLFATRRCGSDAPVGMECEEHVNPMENASGECDGEGIVSEETIWVYYVDNGELCSEQCTVKWLVMDVFDAWKERNGIGEEVLLLDYEPCSNSIEQTEYMHVIVSKSLETYYEQTDETLLLESLEQTLSAYFGPHFTEYHFTLEEE